MDKIDLIRLIVESWDLADVWDILISPCENIRGDCIVLHAIVSRLRSVFSFKNVASDTARRRYLSHGLFGLGMHQPLDMSRGLS